MHVTSLEMKGKVYSVHARKPSYYRSHCSAHLFIWWYPVLYTQEYIKQATCTHLDIFTFIKGTAQSCQPDCMLIILL